MKPQNILKVLLVEDDPGDTCLIQEFVSRASEPWAEVTCVGTLADVLETLPALEPDVVLMDLGLPDSSGMNGLRKVRSAAPLIPMVILTGLDDPEFAERAVAEGAQDYLLKRDVTPGVLQRVLRYAVERMGTWRAIKESESKYQELFENAPEMLMSADPETSRIIECNATLTRLTGWSAEELVGRPMEELYHPDSREGMREIVERTKAVGRVVERELEIQTRAGTSVPVSLNLSAHRDPSGRLIFIRSSIRDITVRRRAEEGFATSIRELRILGRISDTFLAREDDTVYSAVLEQVLEATGCDYGLFGTLNRQGDLVVRAMSQSSNAECQIEGGEVVLPMERWQHSLLGRAMAEGTTQWANQGPFNLPVGHITLHRVLATPIRNQNQPVGLLTVANRVKPFEFTDAEFLEKLAAHMVPILDSRIQRDVQAQHRQAAERKLRRLNKTLEERVEARTAELDAANQELQAFAYSVSHDLRGPLRAIDGFSKILADEYGGSLDEEARRLLGVVRENTTRMGQLIEDLLEFSRVGQKSMHRRAVDMESLAKAAVEELRQGVWDGRGEIRIGTLPEVMGDPPLLRQVWVNLLSNAAKFTRNEEEPRVEVEGWEDDGMAFYRVADNGVGFDMVYADKLFGVFDRLHRQDEFEGTGVGLALVSRILHRHGGHIRGEGVVGKGATFWFTLPL